jgi:hypothetical protein
MIFVVVVIAVFVAIFVVIFPHLMAVPICLVAVAISISIPRYLPATVSPSVISVMVVSPPIVGVVIVPDNAVAEARIISEARFILAAPFPIFPLALAAQSVVLDIVIPAFSQPLPVIRIVVSVIVA